MVPGCKNFSVIKLEKEIHVPVISLTLVPQPMIDSVPVVLLY